MSDHAPTTAARIRRARWERGLTIDQAAEALGVTRRTLARWERGRTVPRAGDIALLEALPVVPLEDRRVG